MFSPTLKLKIFASLCGILFAVGLTQLFLLRFEAGNVYPLYSSLRSDPMGTRVLFHGYDRLSSDTVERNYRPWQHIKLNEKTTMMIIGVSDTRLAEENCHEPFLCPSPTGILWTPRGNQKNSTRSSRRPCVYSRTRSSNPRFSTTTSQPRRKTWKTTS